MKVLFIGGTGLISSACSELAAARGLELFILNRNTSTRHSVPAGARLLVGDVHGDALGHRARVWVADGHRGVPGWRVGHRLRGANGDGQRRHLRDQCPDRGRVAPHDQRDV